MLAAERLHADDTTVPILAKGKTVTGHIWTYVRDDRPFGGRAPPAALYYASRDRRHEHPERHLAGFGGILQADAYSGYNTLFDPARVGGPHRRDAAIALARPASVEMGAATPASRRLTSLLDRSARPRPSPEAYGGSTPASAFGPGTGRCRTEGRDPAGVRGELRRLRRAQGLRGMCPQAPMLSEHADAKGAALDP